MKGEAHLLSQQLDRPSEELSRRRIVHVDINSYFATMLEQENPALRGRAFGIVKDEGRTCLIAVSKAAKRLGIKTGTRLQEARQILPDILTVPAEFDRYLDCTRRLHQLFLRLAPGVQIFSLDEAFLDITECQQMYPDAQAFGELVQAEIQHELGEWVTCSVGVSYNRLLAKMAGEIAGQNGILQITEDNRDSFLAVVDFKDVCGIGYRLEKKLRRLGIEHPYALNLWSLEELLPIFGPYWSVELKLIGRGEESKVLRLLDERTDADMKSVGRSITGWQPCDDENQIKQTLYNLTVEVVSKVRRMNMAGRMVGVYLWGEGRGGGYGYQSSPEAQAIENTWGAHRTLPYYVRHTNEMFDLIYNQLYQSWPRSFRVMKFGVWLAGLRRLEHVPIPLSTQWSKRELVEQAIDTLTNRYGLFTVKPASLVNFQMIRPEVTGFLGDKKYYGLG